MKRLIDYQEDLIESLKDPEEASAYLNAALQDNDPSIYIMALNNMLKAKADDKQLHSIYPLEDDPTLTTVKKTLKALGLTLTIQKRR